MKISHGFDLRESHREAQRRRFGVRVRVRVETRKQKHLSARSERSNRHRRRPEFDRIVFADDQLFSGSTPKRIARRFVREEFEDTRKLESIRRRHGNERRSKKSSTSSSTLVDVGVEFGPAAEDARRDARVFAFAVHGVFFFKNR